MPFFLLLLALLSAHQISAQTLQPVPSRDTLELTLPAAVQRGLRLGDEARVAAYQVDIADAQVIVARASGLPQLRLNGSQSHVMQSARASAVGSIFNQPNTYTANATLSQTLFQGGRILAASRAARHVRAAARLDQTETIADASLNIQRAYLDALFARNLADIQDTSLALASARLAQVQEFLRAGRASRYDVLRAGVERANIEPVAIQARSDVELALIELKRLINLPFDQPVKLTTTIDTATVSAWIERLLTDPAPITRPAVRSAELVAEARHAGVRVAKADLLPSVSFTGLVGAQAFPLNGFPTARGRFETVPCPADSPPDRVCSAQNGGWFGDKSFGIQVGFPLFDGFRARGAIQLANAQARLADLELAQTRESVASEAASARAELDRARAAFAARGQNAAEALEAFRLAELRQSRGLATQLEVADAQLALTIARTNEARAVYDLYLAAAAYARALGRPPQVFDLSGFATNTSPTSPNNAQ
jgi:outer membrane protein TolC